MAGASAVRFNRAAKRPKPIDARPRTKIGAVAPTQRGPIGTQSQLLTIEDFRKIYGEPTVNTYEAYLQLKSLFEEAGEAGGAVVHFSRVVHTTTPGDPTTKTSAAATLMLATAVFGATQGKTTSAVGPFALAHGQTISVAFELGGTQTFTISAVAAQRTSAVGPYVLADGFTLTMEVNGVAVPTKTFLASEFLAVGAATAAEVISSLNAHFATHGIALVATLSAGAVRLTTTRLGTSASINITGGSANAVLLFTTGALAGTGNVANSLAVTAAEWVTIMAAITNGTATNVGGALQLASATTGVTSTAQVLSASTADTAMGFDNAVHAGFATAAQNTLKVDGKTDGIYANDLSIKVAAATNGSSTRFNLSVVKGGVEVERFFNLSLDDDDVLFAEKVINVGAGGQLASNLITVTDQDSTLPSPSHMPLAGTFGPMAGGDDGLVGLADTDFTGAVTVNGRTGMRVLDTVDGLAILICPGRATSAVHNGMINWCESIKAGGCFAVLDTPANLTAAQMITYVESTASLQQLSELAEINWPRILVDNPDASVFGDDATVLSGPSGAYAGLCARMDQSKDGGAFEHPASSEKGFLRSARGLETEEVKDDAVRGLVFDALINPVMQKTGTQVYLDGARCLKDNGPFATVGESRGILFLQLQIGPALDGKRNQNLRPRLYNEQTMAVEGFMKRLTKKECFASNLDEEAWFWNMGPGINTQEDKDARQSNGILGVATSKPNEFINVTIVPL